MLPFHLLGATSPCGAALGAMVSIGKAANAGDITPHTLKAPSGHGVIFGKVGSADAFDRFAEHIRELGPDDNVAFTSLKHAFIDADTSLPPSADASGKLFGCSPSV